MSFYRGPYISQEDRRERARQHSSRLGEQAQPVVIQGLKIVDSFWGKAWCQHLESFSDYANRLPRGRTYVRNGSVCHLCIRPGKIEAQVSGSSLYKVEILVSPLKPELWDKIKSNCAGQIASLLELLGGRLSDRVLQVVTDRTSGLFPQPSEIQLHCTCPDWASMCKHVAAVLYGVGHRLDKQPDLLFLLRQLDPMELFRNLGSTSADERLLADESLSDIFGIDLELD
ncbi:SWIM zinc finger family protein [bacterium]|nr:SWIM zinc finger family protein [bacterium]